MKRENFKLCLGASENWGIGLLDLLKLIKETGFDGFFIDWKQGVDVKEIKRAADSAGLIFQSIHAPYVNSHLMWQTGKEASIAVSELLSCLEDCRKSQVPIMVCHAIIGFDKHSPSQEGVDNFKIVVEKARKYGIKIAFENTEGEEYLSCLMDAFAGYENVGFCWDTGHELCYNLGKDMLSLYGNRLISTHINDNLGASDPANIFWTDDLHLLPFDGNRDWGKTMAHLDRYGYKGEMTFELCKSSKPSRHENDKYDVMTVKDYVAEIYNRAVKLAEMRK